MGKVVYTSEVQNGPVPPYPHPVAWKENKDLDDRGRYQRVSQADSQEVIKPYLEETIRYSI